MIVDNTSLFRAHAKMIQARAKRESCGKTDNKLSASKPEDSQELFHHAHSHPISKKFLSYSSKATEIRQDITELRDIVVNRRRDYISAVGHYRELALTSGMNDWERNQMDTEVDKAMQQCVRLIHAFKRQVAEDTSLRAADEAPHFREIGHMLDKYLKKIAKIVSELRAVRLMKVQNMKKLSRLSTLVKMNENMNQNSPPSLKTDVFKAEKMDLLEVSSNFTENAAKASVELRKRLVAKKEKEAENAFSKTTELVTEESYNKESTCNVDKETAEVMDSELEEQLLMENEHLYAKLIHADDDIQRVEKQLNEIYKLQESFAEKVLEQKKDIEFVNQAAVTSVENIRDGNEQIREAIQNMASRRVVLLFCLIALTFTLLFLDWYNA